MKARRIIFGLVVVLVALSVAIARMQATFVDVPPCHWAAEAVSRIGSTDAVAAEQAQASEYLAQNAIHQVLEGLRCEAPEWSRSFVVGAPDDWPPGTSLENRPPGTSLSGFDLRVRDLDLRGDQGTATVDLLVVTAGEEYSASGEVELSFASGSWKVAYDSLARLGLPLFP